ncbi:MAG TPA: hypothetical protein VEL79_16185 [Vicinamibacterales bacterium]|nr:hypothetical protein [Vicinamibacterales bacterium]
MSEPIGRFAKRVGASRQAVSRALASGRVRSVERDIRGRWVITDVAAAVKEWEENAARLPPSSERSHVRARRSHQAPRPSKLLVPADQFSVSLWDDVILLARVRADGEPLYLMPMARETAVALASRLLERAGNDDGDDDGDTDRETP